MRPTRTANGLAAKRARHASKVSFKRKGKRYSGRVSSADSDCIAGRRIVLRKKGKGTRRYGTTYTTRSGRSSCRRSRRLRGRVYAVAAPMTTATALCRSARSKQIRG